MKLTIGLPAYGNHTEVWFTTQALRLYQDLSDTEILIVDTSPDGPDQKALQGFATGWAARDVRYARRPARGPAAAKQAVFDEARGEWVVCMDSHVLLAPSSLARLRAWIWANPSCTDLFHGPLIYDDLVAGSDRMDPVWRGDMLGIWAGTAPVEWATPYEIPMMGMGLFGCRKDAWLGFPSSWSGFGGEEGYIHNKVRKAGRKVLCLPFLRWTHYFRSGQPPYPLRRQDRIRNYLLWHAELGMDVQPVLDHFGEQGQRIYAELKAQQAMKVSCICPTFNRVGPQQYLLEEAVESFLRQVGWENRELIIWNDHPQQRVVFDHPMVKVVNEPTRCPTLGEKYNRMVRMATGEAIVPWEDDDISLPRRVAEAALALQTWDYVPSGYFFLDGKGLHTDHPLGYCHGSSAYRKTAWEAVGGYPEVSGPQDAIMDGKLRHSEAVRTAPSPGGPREWQYLYRWGVSSCHLSGQGTNAARAYEENLTRMGGGEIVLKPHWREDYAAMCERARG